MPLGRRVCLCSFAYGKQSVGGTVLKVSIINPKGQTFVLLLEDRMGVGTNTFFFSFQNEFKDQQIKISTLKLSYINRFTLIFL